jgi:hypothetical protein
VEKNSSDDIKSISITDQVAHISCKKDHHYKNQKHSIRKIVKKILSQRIIFVNPSYNNAMVKVVKVVMVSRCS